MIFAMKAVMTLATLCYAIGYASRRRNNAMHRQVMPVAFGLTWAVALLFVLALLGVGEAPKAAYWLVSAAGTPERVRWVLLLHRIIAGVALTVLTAQIVTGLRRDPLHHRLYPYAIGLWAVTYVSGMFLYP